MEALMFQPERHFILEGKWLGKGRHTTKIVPLSILNHQYMIGNGIRRGNGDLERGISSVQL